MKKLYLILVFAFICFGLYSQKVKQNDKAVFTIGSELKKINNNQNLNDFLNFKSKDDTHLLYNFDENADWMLYPMGGQGGWGYWSGHNNHEMTEFAEKFFAPVTAQLNGLVFEPWVLQGNNSITIKVWDDNNGRPGSEIHSEIVDYDDILVTLINDHSFSEPIEVSGNFFIGYEINYPPDMVDIDTFALPQNMVTNKNSFYMLYNGVWSSISELTAGHFQHSNLYIGARVNMTIEEPVLSVNPTSWNAGVIEVQTSTVSPEFSIQNIGVGTLTVTEVTNLEPPWSTDFNPSEVSLSEGDSYSFTFGFFPTITGPFAQNFVINTNGGEITIYLSGTSSGEATDIMDGGFETNVNDFDLIFPGWIQHDVDGSSTYSILDHSFENEGYTGSFIAFNPSATTPPLDDDDDWIAHEGNRYGACFAAENPPNDDWLITPRSEVIKDGAVFRAYVKSVIDDYGLERYTINVSTTGTQISDFTKISTGDFVEAPTSWTLIEYPLSDFIGEKIRIGIRCISDDAFVFMIDNIEIDNPVVSELNKISKISVYPNPATDFIFVKNADNYEISLFNILGETIKTTYSKNINQVIDISGLPKGTYFLKIHTEIFKIIKF